MLRIAVPNKGSLSEPASTMLREAGYRQRSDLKDLVLTDVDNDVEFFFLRPRDIAVYVGEGTLDLGITGRDLLLDSGTHARELMALGFAESTFRFAARPGDATSIADFAGLRVATSYPGLVRRHLTEAGIDAEVIRLDGAVESAVRLGVADVVADVVSTGTTLRQAGLQIVGDVLLHSEAVLIQRGSEPGVGSGDQLPDGTGIGPADKAVAQLIRRLQGVLVARRYVMVAYDVARELLDAATALTPGIESPTISPLQNPDWVAVSAMVPRRDTNRIMDELWEVGARGILVTDIAACRL